MSVRTLQSPKPYSATVLADRVLKESPRPQATLAKYQAVWAVAQASGFSAPAVTRVFEGGVEMERLKGIRSLRGPFLAYQRGSSHDLFAQAGEALGRLHAGLPAAGPAWAAPMEFETALRRYGWAEDWRALPTATLHGDYSFSNVQVMPDGGLAVIDPCPNHASTFEVWETGPIYVDIGKFLSCLEGQVPPLQMLQTSPVRNGRLQEIFLKAYEEATESPLDRAAAHAFAYAAAAVQFRRRGKLRGAIKTSALYNRLRRNFPLPVKLRALAA